MQSQRQSAGAATENESIWIDRRADETEVRVSEPQAESAAPVLKEFRQIVAQLSHARAAAWRSEIGALQTRVQAVDPNLSCEAIG